VPIRGFLLIAIAAGLAGCANDQGNTPGLGMTARASMLGAGTIAREIDAEDMKRAAKQTVSAKMLAAIALERVTGRTPDPARFNELR